MMNGVLLAGLLAGIVVVDFVMVAGDPISDCEQCISYGNFGHLYCWSDNKCYPDGSPGCDESQCTGGWLSNLCDCHSCCGLTPAMTRGCVAHCYTNCHWNESLAGTTLTAEEVTLVRSFHQTVLDSNPGSGKRPSWAG